MILTVLLDTCRKKLMELSNHLIGLGCVCRMVVEWVTASHCHFRRTSNATGDGESLSSQLINTTQGIKPYTSRQFYPSSSFQRKKDNHHHHLQACILLTVVSRTKKTCEVLNDPHRDHHLVFCTHTNK